MNDKIICDIAIVIPSIIHISNPQIENVFTPEQRFQQTIEQLESLRKINKKITIIVVELSFSLSEREKNELSKRCDYFYVLNDALAVQYAHVDVHINKSRGEIYALSKILEKIECNHFIKFGGRYKINDDFNIDTFIQDKPVACYLETVKQCYGIFFSIPKKYQHIFLKKYVAYLLNERHVTTEKIVTHFMIETEGYIVDKLNVSGYGATNGIYQSI